jgi:ectoine hydroxylase-related dioxygenase (phytanoyl-CoA dioxygenase family)
MMPMKKGELIIFPSNLWHSVPSNKSKIERISLSFNTWIKGSFGQKRELTYLPIEKCV